MFVIEQQVAHFRPVRTGMQDGDRVEIVEGIDEGQRVVTTGALAITDGDRVQLQAGAGQNGRGGRGRGGRRGGGPAAGTDASGKQ